MPHVPWTFGGSAAGKQRGVGDGFGGGERGRRCRGGPGGAQSARRGQGQRCQEAETGPGQAGPRDAEFIVSPGALLRKCATPDREKATATKCPCRPRSPGSRTRGGSTPGSRRSPAGARGSVFSVLAWHCPRLAQQTPGARAAGRGFGMTASEGCPWGPGDREVDKVTHLSRLFTST